MIWALSPAIEITILNFLNQELEHYSGFLESILSSLSTHNQLF